MSLNLPFFIKLSDFWITLNICIVVGIIHFSNVCFFKECFGEFGKLFGLLVVYSVWSSTWGMY